MGLLRNEIKVIKERDPAIKSSLEVLLYPSLYAMVFHRIGHFFYKKKLYFVARLISQISRNFTGIEIHPGATIGEGLFIDHGMGVVIGETAEIGDNVTIYQGATLGGTGKGVGKRHPTIGNGVMISAGAKVLGPFKVGDNAKIGAGAVVLKEVPPNTTVIGVPGRAVERKVEEHPSETLNQVELPDPVAIQFCKTCNKITMMENELKVLKEHIKELEKRRMKVFNTITKQKEEIIPLEADKIKMYVCGPTVYNYIHIGNARPLVIFDAFRRFLEYIGYKVIFVQNFTDVDDKIIKRSNEEGITAQEVAENYINEFLIDEKGLNIKKATYNPKVTENMDDIIEMIKTLIDKGNAYAIDGDVYFDTKSFKDYGKLCGQDLEEKVAGARIDVDDRKKNPMDFVLWKAKKDGEPYWYSPWGQGRPGWHIECSVMAKKFLGETIDIHGGGQDLIFPHHENEKAQSECANGKEFARYWVHNGFINVENQKMSKSLNNFFTVREVAEEFDYEVIRFFMLSVHYRKPINFSREIMQQCKNGLDRIYNFINNMEFMLGKAECKLATEEENELKTKLLKYKTEFIDYMSDDINTADAVTAIFEIIRESNANVSSQSSKDVIEFAYGLVKELSGVLGLLNGVKTNQGALSDEEVQKLVEARQEARKNKNWAEADRIRDELKAKGITLEDTPQGLRVVRK